MEELLEIKEFALRAGISRQSVYKAYNNPNSRLHPYVVSTPKGPRIKAQALSDIYDNPEQPQETTADSPRHPETTEETPPVASSQFAVGNQKQPETPPGDNVVLAAAIEALTAQLQEKDKQIERLQLEVQAMQEAAAEKDKFIQEQSKLLSQAHELVRNSQVLLAQGAAAAQAAEDTATDKQPIEQDNIVQEPKKEKKSFLKWLFG